MAQLLPTSPVTTGEVSPMTRAVAAWLLAVVAYGAGLAVAPPAWAGRSAHLQTPAHRSRDGDQHVRDQRGRAVRPDHKTLRTERPLRAERPVVRSEHHGRERPGRQEPIRYDRNRERPQHSGWTRNDHRDRGHHSGRHRDHRPEQRHSYDRHHRHHGHHYHHHHAPAWYWPHPSYAPYWGWSWYSTVGYPYYCDLCDVGFHTEVLFHAHLCDFHHVAYTTIPHVVVRRGGTLFYFAW